MATMQTLIAKYPVGPKRIRIASTGSTRNRRRRNLAPLVPCKRCGTAAIFAENHADLPYHRCSRLIALSAIGTWRPQPICVRFSLEVVSATRNALFRWSKNRVPLHMVGQWNYFNSPGSEHRSPARDVGEFFEVQSRRRSLTGSEMPILVMPLG
jgi:hypothetical protein